MPALLAAQDTLPMIPNGGFETWYEHVSPEWVKKHSINCLSRWYQPTVGSPEYYRSDVKALSNLRDPKTQAHSGKGYAAFIAYGTQTANYREFLGIPLKEKLVEGQTYEIRFWLRLFPFSQYATPDISVGFGSEKWISDTAFNANVSRKTETINKTIKDGHWEPVTVKYTGSGDERFLIIGNFKPDSLCRLVQVHPDIPMGAYYYIDDVEMDRTGEIIPEKISAIDIRPVVAGVLDTLTETPYKLEPGTVNDLPSIHFAVNSDELILSSDAEIDRLFHFLATHPTLVIMITGHTDNTGSREYNDLLSMARARAVAEALVSRGIDPERLHFTGVGSSMPVAPNDSGANRQRNRRVEFVIIKE